MQHLYEAIFYDPKVNLLFRDEAIIQYMLQFESALAQAQAICGVIPGEAAQVISECCQVANINKEQLIADAALGGNVNIPLVKQLTSVVNQKDAAAAKYVHYGATSQDVIDSAVMLQLKDAIDLIAKGLDVLIEQLTLLVETHRNTVMIGRSFMQQARPITFGFKVAHWLDGILRSKEKVDDLLKENFVLQLGGAVGTFHGMMGRGLMVAEKMSGLLGLKMLSIPWHTQRDCLAAIATTLGILNGSLGKIAKDISLLMQTEIAEVFEPSGKGKGGSSTMPHKRNPVGCIAILANVQRVPSLVATMLGTMVQDHERGTGTWHAEWETISAIVQLTAGSLRKATEVTNGLEVDKEQMLRNIEITKGLIFAENISLALAEKIGKQEAHELIEKCCQEVQRSGMHLKNIVLENTVMRQYLTSSEIEGLFDPVRSIGLCEEWIKRVLNI
ncbi:3-carboxy-cis,cis-muconate cycloisomerase [Chitinophagaceae bacterium LB-8]|uniref:3-carboxy-cis,cis-muconate cycloisomerase n=1 Tax=Paraflavisolibacter caeni TaxID=2982496 RepID=A0A9X2XUZ5_9BACT|nr:3-carboxy-cis,cis-muconate cycloisomerase [Paraflavisolibacter caeni]MCU7549784.1 3-carboxy-cis,cis-muconate cycloisomerase [Paraflavisolibacter caeni]